MFPRDALRDLEAWRKREQRRPLVIRGARQTGKSFLARLFARASFESMVEINFESDPSAVSLFESLDPRAIVPLLEAHCRSTITPGRTLLFLDEVQAAPRVLSALRYFHEQLPELHVVAAGSLLDFALAQPETSVPVGRIEYLHLGPVQFEEFLVVAGDERLRDVLAGWRVGDPFPEAVHRRLTNRLREYLSTGGMPASVAAFVASGSFLESDRVKHSVVSTFRDDFAKYGRRVDVARVRKVFDALPALVCSRFKYTLVDREVRARELSVALDLLCMARVAHRVRHSSGNGVPLAAEADDGKFKVLYLDVGLLLAARGLGPVDLARANDLTLVNEGRIAEQFVGQHLLQPEASYMEPDLFFWTREARGSSAEVDYLLAVGPEVVPVEVKAGRSGTLKSLHLFLEEKDRHVAVRLNSEPPSLLDANAPVPGGPRKAFRLLSLPLYMVGQVRRLASDLLGR